MECKETCSRFNIILTDHKYEKSDINDIRVRLESYIVIFVIGSLLTLVKRNAQGFKIPQKAIW